MHKLEIPYQPLFDKPQIVAIIKKALRRLRKDKITIDQVIAHIQVQGVEMTRARFEDLFTTRPLRMNGAPPEVLIAMIHALFQLKRDVLSTQEIMELANASRLPIKLFGQIVEYFNMQEWQELLHMHLPATRAALEKKEIIGRNVAFHRLYTHMQKNAHIVISGPQGIGKTTLAYALVREYEINYCCRIPHIEMTKTPASLKELFEIIASAFAIKPLYKEPIKLRINSVLKNSQIYYLLLDNYPTTNDDTLQTIVKLALQRLPMIRLIITSRQTRQFSQLDTHVEETLEPLSDIDFQSPAFQLFSRVLKAHGSNESLLTTAHLKQCQLAQGNPFNILLIANMYVNHNDYHGTAQATSQLIATLSHIELHIIEFITLCRKKVTATLLTHYTNQLSMNETQLQETLQQLVSRGIINYTSINGTSIYTIHDVLMHAFLNFENHALITNQKLQQILRRLIAITHPFKPGTIPVLSRNDVQILIELTRHIVEINESQIILVMKLLIAYELVWIHYASAAQVIVIAETCIAKCTVPHPVIYKLHKLLGNLYKYRGLNETANYYFSKAITQFHQSNETLEWAHSMLDFSFNLNKALFSDEQISAIQNTLTIFQDHDAQYAHACGLDCLSRIYLQKGDITNALTYCQKAMNEFAGMTNTVGYVDALIHKALLYMILNDYEIARQLFAQVIHTTEINQWAHLNAVAKLRMAATLMFDSDHVHARQYLAQAAEVLLRLWNTGEILFVVDVYSLILLAENKILTALQFSDMSTLLREQLNSPRGIVLDALVKSKRENIFTQHTNLVYTPPTHVHNIYEVINIIRTELQ